MPMSPAHEDLMQHHLRDENLSEAMMSACSINKVLKGQKGLSPAQTLGSGKPSPLLLPALGPTWS